LIRCSSNHLQLHFLFMVWDLIIGGTDYALWDAEHLAWQGRWLCFDTLGRCEIRAGCQILACFGSSPWRHITALTRVKGFITLYQYLETCSVYSNHVNACRRSHPVLALEASAQPAGERCAHLRAELAQPCEKQLLLWHANWTAHSLCGELCAPPPIYRWKSLEVHLICLETSRNTFVANGFIWGFFLTLFMCYGSRKKWKACGRISLLGVHD